jgi:hypothetical protein
VKAFKTSVYIFTILILISNPAIISSRALAVSADESLSQGADVSEEAGKSVDEEQIMAGSAEGVGTINERQDLYRTLLMLAFIIAVLFFPLKKLIRNFLDFLNLGRSPKVDIPENMPPDIKRLVKKLHSTSQEKRWEAANKLGERGRRAAPAIPYLVNMLKNKYFSAEKTVLTKKSPEDKVSLFYYIIAPLYVIFKAIDKTNSRFKSVPVPGMLPIVSVIVTSALAKIGTPAVSALIGLLKDGDKFDKKAAADALGRIGDASAVEPLVELLKDKHDFVRKSAGLALKNITDKDFGEDPEKWRQWREENKEAPPFQTI